MYADAAATQTPDIYLFHTPALRGMLKRLRLSFSLFSETFEAAAEQLNTCLRSEYCRTSGCLIICCIQTTWLVMQVASSQGQ